MHKITVTVPSTGEHLRKLINLADIKIQSDDFQISAADLTDFGLSYEHANLFIYETGNFCKKIVERVVQVEGKYIAILKGE